MYVDHNDGHSPFVHDIYKTQAVYLERALAQDVCMEKALADITTFKSLPGHFNLS